MRKKIELHKSIVASSDLTWIKERLYSNCLAGPIDWHNEMTEQQPMKIEDIDHQEIRRKYSRKKKQKTVVMFFVFGLFFLLAFACLTGAYLVSQKEAGEEYLFFGFLGLGGLLSNMAIIWSIYILFKLRPMLAQLDQKMANDISELTKKHKLKHRDNVLNFQAKEKERIEHVKTLLLGELPVVMKTVEERLTEIALPFSLVVLLNFLPSRRLLICIRRETDFESITGPHLASLTLGVVYRILHEITNYFPQRVIADVCFSLFAIQGDNGNDICIFSFVADREKVSRITKENAMFAKTWISLGARVELIENGTFGEVADFQGYRSTALLDLPYRTNTHLENAFFQRGNKSTILLFSSGQRQRF